MPWRASHPLLRSLGRGESVSHGGSLLAREELASHRRGEDGRGRELRFGSRCG